MSELRYRILVPAAVGLLGLASALTACQHRLVTSEAAGEASNDAGEPSADGAPSLLTDAQLKRLSSLGYLEGYDEVRDEPTGVVHRSAEGAQPGLNLYVSAHAPEAILMTLDGETLHSWRRPFTDVCPDADPEGLDDFFHRARVLPNGDLLAIFDYAALFRLDKDSRLIWAQCRRYHHDFTLAADGRIYAVGRNLRRVTRGERGLYILDDVLEILDSRGEILKSVSVHDAFVDSAYASMVSYTDLSPSKRKGDIFHVNAVKWLDGRHEQRFPAAKRGNVLISIRNLSTIAIVDMELKRVVWALKGSWRFQHESVLLDNGHIMLFDNYGSDEHSRVIELDPLTGETVWQYTESGPEDFFSPTLGSNERLANGNTLINLSARGRALEVTPDHALVWEFRSPHSVQDGELIATLQYLTRLREDFPIDWLPDRPRSRESD